ncbi:hypothetical protein [Paenibacillus kandeliae]|uniref:hypothetical protein n=1 Tax=Paenibacillus kandeliae TaxID=3231269 RepID=UPI0034584E7B
MNKVKNFAEELVYWYLRFNGFFPLANFVLHREGLCAGSQSADADLIAIRPKFVYEEIGVDHKDPMLFKHFSMKTNIGLMCEVKSGNYVSREDIHLGRKERISYCLKRIGFFSNKKLQEHSKTLESHPIAKGDFHQVGKLLVTKREMHVPGFICLSLDHIEKFIMERISLFSREKDGAKLHFDSDMLQYMIWKHNM